MRLVTIEPTAVKLQRPAAHLGMAGPAPQLQWLRIEDLVVDLTYQRQVTNQGRRNIAAIASGFRWSRFSCVVVSPIAGGKFAIVDGQHRVTAAALVGFETVPCQIIMATPGEQAEAFTAINSAVTRIHRMSLHKAAVAAGDPKAVQIETVAAAANVTVLPYPKSESNQAPGETMAVGALQEAISRYGPDVVTLALRCVRETKNDVRGCLTAPIVMGLSSCINGMLEVGGWERADVIPRFDKVVIIREADKARVEVKPKGISTWSILANRLLARAGAPPAAAARLEKAS